MLLGAVYKFSYYLLVSCIKLQIVLHTYFVAQTTADDIICVTRESVLIDGRQSACVLCCYPRHLLVFAETSKFHWTVKRSWKAKQVYTLYLLLLYIFFVYRFLSIVKVLISIILKKFS